MNPRNVEDIYPLAPIQHGVLFHSLMADGEDVYFRQLTFILRGPLEVKYFRQAWQEVLDRNSILRTAFIWDETEEPVQVVCRRVELPFDDHDWRVEPPERRKRLVEDLLERDRRRGFAFAEAPLLRLAVLRLDDDVQRVVLSYHHLTVDGWSLALVRRQAMSYYRSRLAGRSPTIPPARPYRDYVAWLKSRDMAAAEAYWRRALDGFSAPTSIAFERPGSDPLAFVRQTASHRRELTESLATALAALGRRHQLTLNTLIQGAWAILLSRTGDSRDVVFGATVAGRPTDLPGFERMVGLFINTLPVRVRIDPAAALVPNLERLQREHVDARQFEFTPLLEIQKWSQVERGRRLFDSILVFENYPVERSAAGNNGSLRVEATRTRASTNYPLTVIIKPGTALRLRILYDVDRFDATASTRALGQLVQILTEMVRKPDLPLGALALLPLAQRLQLLVEWNDTATVYPGPGSIPESFRAQARQTPSAAALIFEEQQLSYEGLAERVSRLTSRLRTSGVGSEAVVGVYLERSVDLVVTLLSILEAGGAYLPLAPELPPTRLAWMMEDAGMSWVVSSEELASGLPDSGVRVLRVDSEGLYPRSEQGAGSLPAPCPDRLAYVIYTSGSTGRPKGVQVPHRALMNFLRAMQAELRLGSGETVLAITTLSFDISVLELLWPLVVGGRTVVAPAGTSADGKELGRRITASGARVVQATPSSWQLWAASPWQSASGLKLLSGGEDLSDPLAAELMARGGEVWNLYGPTETTVWSSASRLASGGEVTLGRPISNTTFYVLDRGLGPLPVSAAGELYIGGGGVTRGYLGRPGLTAERFVPDPYEAVGSRLYQTGDLVRQRVDGAVEYLGRLDHQVKVRGYRIELGEIEAALEGLPGVHQAVVVVREDRAGDPRLTAYLVASSQAPPAPADLRESLRRELPAYMVPAAFVTLAELPLLASGKVDRKALPAPEISPRSVGDPPADEGTLRVRTPTEELMLEIWSEVLGWEVTDPEADFFDLGGHSLLAMRVISRVHAAFGMDLPMRALFEAPTVAGLAARVETVQGTGAEEAPPIEPASRCEAVPLSFAQERMWFLDRLEPGSAAYTMPYALGWAGSLDPAALSAAFSGVARRHEVLRTVYQETADSPEQVIVPASVVAVPLVDLSALPTLRARPEGRRVASEQARRSFDLERGPVLRVLALRLGAEEHAVLWTLHHIASDGWSMEIFRRELRELYRAAVTGEASSLPVLPVQYADYAVWQRQWLRDEQLSAELEHWRRRLAGLPPVLDLPLDRPRPSVMSYRGSSVRFALPSSVSTELRMLGRRQGATLFMVMLTAFEALLSRYSGQEDLAVGTPVAGRRRLEVENLIGFFVNTLVLRGDLSGDPSFQILLGRVRETVLDAHAHQDLPFEKLVAELRPQRSLSHPPLFQVTLLVGNAALAVSGGSAIEAASAGAVTQKRGLSPSSGTTKFDLTLSVSARRERLVGVLSYSTDLFDRSTAQHLAGHLARLVEAAARSPERRLSELSLLSRSERQQTHLEWNDTASSYERDLCIHQLFERQARRTPQAVALVFDGGELRYGELDARAAILAGHLRRFGVGPEVRVGVFLERSPELVLAMVAILKAGSAYVPLDPSYPPERLAFMCADSGIRVLVSCEGLADRLPTSDAVRTVYLDTDLDTIEAESTALPRSPSSGSSADHLAYVMYTSGSTGVPKGVAVTHRNVVSLLRGVRYADLGARQVFLQLTAVSFDPSTVEIWAPLFTGGRLAIFPPIKPSLRELESAITHWGVTTLHLTAGIFHQFAEELVSALRPVKQLMVGGDVVSAAHVRRVLNELPGMLFLDCYGPSENSTFSTLEGMREGARVGGQVSIGRPIANRRALVLGRALRPVPIGVSGDLYVAGAGLARGYLERPALTAGRFLPDPRPMAPGGRLYRSGDLARHLPDGRLLFLGRVDRQVKVRGYRVELGEIEAALGEHPAVAEAVVQARGIGPERRRLVAFVMRSSAPSAGSLSEEQLREHLASRVPSYMVPSILELEGELPLNANGKLDRSALARWEVVPPVPAAGGSVAPRAPGEELLAAIWAEVLGFDPDRVGIDADFFDLGGHSLLATRVISRVHAAFGVDLPLRALFEAPTLAGLAARIEAVQGTGVEEAPIKAVSRRGSLPLSFAQERLWFLDRLEPGSAAYTMPNTLGWAGSLDPAALSAAFGEVVRRHEVLRTVYREAAGSPEQVIAPASVVAVPLVDLSTLPPPRARSERRRLSSEEARRPFDLVRGPVLRVTALRLGSEDHAVLWTLHHIASDGWSREILRREVRELYRAAVMGEVPSLPPLPVQYADYAVWQRQGLRGERLSAAVEHWRRRLADLPPVLELPLDHPRPPVMSYRGSTVKFALSASVSTELRALGRREGATLFMVMLAAFEALQSRYSGQEDLAVGTPVAGRQRLELENLIGFFVNTLVLRGDLSGDPSFCQLLARTRETVLDAHAHQDVPFEKLVAELRPQRSLSHPPLFQVMLLVGNAALDASGGASTEEASAGAAIRKSGLSSSSGTTKFDLTLSVSARREQLAGALSYSTDLFDRSTAQRLAGHLASLVEAAVESPERRLSELPLLPRAQRRQLLVEWNDTAAAQSGPDSIPEAFAVQAQRTPSAPALIFEERQLSYGELAERVNRLAHHLRSSGVGPEALVGVYLERSVELVVTLLAILEAGAAYLPLDPESPTARLGWMMEDAGLRWVVSSEELAPRLPEAGARVLRAEAESACPEAGEGLAPLVPPAPEQLAYVIYTSGSTGRPKGVMNRHGSIRNRLFWMQSVYDLSPGDRVLQKTPSTFDVSVWEFFWPLMFGATLVVARPGGHRDAGYLVEVMSGLGITMVHFVPSMLRAFLEHPEVERCTDLRQVISSGEALASELTSQFHSRLGAELDNLYGPTEAAIDVTWWPCRGSEEDSAVPIGRPIANTCLRVSDRGLRAVPAGVPGQLCLGGVGLARGYLSRPGLTSERFVPDPYGVGGSRLYQTGDLVRPRADGVMEYLGRLDHQVKVRGYRIELGEIEAALERLPGVEQAVALVREDRAADPRLTAYLVASSQAPPAPAELRESLRRELPAYMVPAAVVALADLPLLTSGKVDRKALPAPETGPRSGEVPSAEERALTVRTPTEELMLGIWSDVLGWEVTDPEADFFDLGGHSLLATRVISRVYAGFGVDLPLRALFEAPTVAGLAARIEVARVEAVLETGVEEAPPIVPASRRGSLPLSFAQERLWFLDRLEPGGSAYIMSYTLGWAGSLDPAALSAALSGVARRHEVLRTVYRETAESPEQVIVPASVVAVPLVDLSALPTTRARSEGRRLASEEARRPFDLVRGPVLRVTALHLGSEEHAVLWTLHHIASDGWSMEIFRRELRELYGAAVSGEAPSLSRLPVQYSDYAVWQRQWLREEHLSAELEYWRCRLAGLPPVLDLPLDRPRPSVMSYRGSAVRFALPSALSQELRELGRREGATLFMVMLAAFEALLSRSSGQDDLAVGTPVAGRQRLEVENLIGFFVNTLVLRGDLSGDPSFRQLLGRARETVLDAHAHQDVPFEKLVAELRPQRSLSHPPLFQVMLLVGNAALDDSLGVSHEASSAGGAIQKSGLSSSSRTTKFDLKLSVSARREHFVGRLSYRTDLFDQATASRLAGSFVRLVEATVAAPERRLTELSVLSRSARQQLLREWNDTRAAAPVPIRCVHELFAERAREVPDALALRFEEVVLTYGDLDRRSDRVAAGLRELGVGPETRVAICMERSWEMISGLLAILKAGAAYVPLDPSHPDERLAFMMKDSGVELLLTQDRQRFRLREARLPAITFEASSTSVARREVSLRRPGVAPGHLAYVLFTSGSSGRPKGVAVEHRQLFNYLRGVLSRLELSGPASFATVSTLAADLGNTGIFVALCTGGCLHVLGEERISDPEAAADYFCRHPVDGLKIVPSHLAALQASARGAAVMPRHRLILGGEALYWGQVEQLFSLDAGFVLLNHYGPTESTVGVTTSRLGRCAADPGAIVPLGRPMANIEACLLDRRGRPVDLGTSAELCLGGANLARGYLGRPALTAERFVPHPSSAAAGARLYRTGDRVRYLPDGRLDFRGRLDSQVKVRGFRIEVGEVESALASHSAISEVAVVTRGEGSEACHLVAYLTVSGPAPSTAELREHLRRTLPEYMVPSRFAVLETLPHLSTGKMDRRALAELEPRWETEPRGEAGTRAAEGPPSVRTPTEELLLEIWSEVLGREVVNLKTDFFDLGGHSLLATRVISRVRQAFRVDLALRALFEAPTVAGLASRIETALRAGAEVLAPIEPVARRGSLPLSFAQERLWFLDRLVPSSAAYTVPHALGWSGSLDPAALSAAFSEVVRRHEVLRTVYQEAAGSPEQVIAPASVVAVPLVDLSDLAPPRARSERRRLVSEEARRPFDLGRGPVLRVTALRLGSEDHAVLWTLHHIASDGWSREILRRELRELYRAAVLGEAPSLPQLPVQYADYAVWQRQWLRGERLSAEVEHWRRCLADLPPVLELPLDYPRPPVMSYRGSTVRFALSASVSTELRALGRREGATLFMVMLSAFEALLSRYSGQEDLAVGTPVAGRQRLEVENLIGFFVNTLVLRGDLSGDPSFCQLLGRARETVLDAHAHQDVPFEKLVAELRPQRSLSHPPLFQVMLLVGNAALAAFGGASTETASAGAVSRKSGLSSSSGTTKFDLTLSVSARREQFVGGLSYSTDLFDQATASRLAGTFVRLVEATVAAPERRLSELSVLSRPEAQQLLWEWNDGASVAVAEGVLCLHERIFAQVSRTTESVAVVSAEGAVLTYGELARRSLRLASRLRLLEVGPEALVGVLLDRTPELVTSVLGVLASGSAYLPLDPAYPAERLSFMLEDSGATVVVTRGSLARRLPSGSARWVDLEADLETGDELAELGEVPTPVVEVSSLAYLIYTSGSTGRPKGVAIPHRSASSLLSWASSAYGAAELSGVLSSTSICFDLSVYELFAPLSVGGRVILVRDALTLPEVSEHGVTLVNTVPSAMAELCQQDSLPSSVRTVNLAGEPLHAGLVSSIRRRLPEASVWNLYGPSEDTTYSTAARVPMAAGEPTIGRPLPGTAGHVVDRCLVPVPVGVWGELLLGGEGLARGYLGRGGLTAERFVPDPFGAEPGVRLYRTGDLVCRRIDGELAYLGRIDHQVKVRGFRIELGEVESALASHAMVSEVAVVVVRGERAEERRLVAYLTASGRAPSTQELRAHLRRTLPEHMVPSIFAVLETLPRLSTGKMDRRALAALEPTLEAELQIGSVAPRDEIELRVATILEELLQVRPVGATDDFFTLGGHSLLAVRLMARLRRELGRELPLATLFRHPTVAGLATALRRERENLSEPVRQPALVELVAGGPRPPFFLVHPVGGNIFCYRPLALLLGTDRSVYALQAHDPGDGLWDKEDSGQDGGGQKGTGRMSALAERYLEEVRAVQPRGPYLIGGWSMGGLVAYEMVRRLAELGEIVAPPVLIDSRAPRLDRPVEPLAEHRRIAGFARDLGGLFGRELKLPAADLRGEPRTLLRRVYERAREVGALLPDLEFRDLERLYATFRRNLEVVRTYRPTPWPGGLLLFRAVGASAAESALRWHRLVGDRVADDRVADDRVADDRVADDKVEVLEFPCGHFDLLRRPTVELLANELRCRLKRLDGNDLSWKRKYPWS